MEKQSLVLEAVRKHLLHGRQKLAHPGQPLKDGVRINEVETLLAFPNK